MKPSAINYVFGYGWKIATYGGAISLGALIASYGGITSVWRIVELLPALPLGWIAGALIMWPILQTVGSRVNGAPWCEGDLVYVLVGKNRGHSGRIYEIWSERGQIRVDLSEQAKTDVTDVYFFNEVCRAGEESEAVGCREGN